VPGKRDLIAFYSGSAPDDRGRYRSDILAWNDDQLEAVHDYIQWLFPLREPSPVNPSAPRLTDAIVEEFRLRDDLQANLRESFERMERFYKAPARHWLTPNNHNHLRITRILKCLMELGLEDCAVSFFEWLRLERTGAPSQVTEVTFRFWQSAIRS
jgi:hypothetical protein